MTDEEKQREIADWKARRQRGRSDLIWLCRHVLGYKDVDPVLHGQLARNLQKLWGGKDIVDDNGMLVEYRPYCPSIWDMRESDRKPKTLTLIPRFHLKTTVCTIAHTIQWILNYPDVRVCISTSTGEIAEGFVSAIRRHFQFNEILRYLYPEYCPPAKKSADWGNNQSFTVMNRRAVRREPTVSCISVGKQVASWHYDVIKNDDLVDKENVKTKEQVENTKSHFAHLWPLLDVAKDSSGKSGWMDVVGTIYDHSDLHAEIVRRAEAAPDHEGWAVLKLTAENEVNGVKTALWPAGCPLSRLEDLRREMGSAAYNAQMNMNPIGDGQGLATAEKIVWTPRSEMNKLLSQMRQHVTIDLAGMELIKGMDTDFTAMSHCGFDRDGRLYVNDVRHGRFSQAEAMEQIFDLYDRYPRIVEFKIQLDNIARGFMPSFRRECAKRNKWPNLVPIPVDNRKSKPDRIRGLQSLFEFGAIRFADDLPCRKELEDEIVYFPKFAHDDILDTIADQLQNSDGQVNSDVYGVEPQPEAKKLFVKNEDGSITLLGHPAERMGDTVLYGEQEEMTGVCPTTGY